MTSENGVLKIYFVFAVFSCLIKATLVQGDGTYLGCYMHQSRILSVQSWQKENTPERCRQICSSQSGMAYAGVEYGSECWCGDTIASSAPLAPDSDCNGKCPGDRTLRCGGPHRVAIYRTCALNQYGPNCQNTCPCHDSSQTCHCLNRIDLCHPHNGTCLNNQCEPGWTGNTCQQDIDECDTITNICGTNSTCTNTEGSFTCVCDDGYVSSTHGSNCSDFDECNENAANCDQNSHCVNTVGSFTCSCDDGYVSSTEGDNCSDFDECGDSSNICGPKGLCINIGGSYTCECLGGYSGTPPHNVCKDIDECTINPSVCGQNALCSNIEGSFECDCRAGFTGNASERCTDFNECESDMELCKNGQCNNTYGSFKCTCSDGFYLDDSECKTLESMDTVPIIGGALGSLVVILLVILVSISVFLYRKKVTSERNQSTDSQHVYYNTENKSVSNHNTDNIPSETSSEDALEDNRKKNNAPDKKAIEYESLNEGPDYYNIVDTKPEYEELKSENKATLGGLHQYGNVDMNSPNEYESVNAPEYIDIIE